mgnify:CR=1 FL=1
MRCKTCQYPLWGISARQCPECGGAFKPSDFEFVVNSVQFRCPQCEQDYYGDGPRGHLDPAAFECVRCGRPLAMDDMVLSPTAGVKEERTETKKMPWLERRRIGGLKGWLKTIWMAMISPGELIAATPRESSMWTALWFLVLTQVIFWVVAALPMWGVVMGSVATFATGRSGAVMGPMAAGLAMMFGIGIGMTLLLGLVFALLAHVLLRITGKTPGGIRRTLQVMAYSSGAHAVLAIPCMGAFIAWLWWAASAAAMLKQAHAVRWWRAIVAVALPIAAAGALTTAAYVGVIVFAFRSASAASVQISKAATKASEVQQVKKVTTALTMHAAAAQSWPRHVGELIVSAELGAEDFVGGPTGWTKTDVDDVWIGNTPLGVFKLLSAAESETLVEHGAEQDSQAAYRLGDFVICVRADQSVALDPGLWIVMSWPDPLANESSDLKQCVVGRRDGTVVVVEVTDLDDSIAAQNRLRKEHGLPELKHPRDVAGDVGAVEDPGPP